MKNTLLLLTAILLSCPLLAQDYKVGFSANGLATQIDSVEIENTTQDKTITVYGQDTLHLLGVVSNIENLESTSDVSLYPNPATECSYLEFYSEQNTSAELTISDVSGKCLLLRKIKATAGKNRIRISGLNRGVYILSLATDALTYSRKLIFNGNHNGNLHAEKTALTKSKLSTKSTKADGLVEWQYDDGDILIFKAWALGYSRIKVYYITSDINLSFNLVQCQDPDGNDYTVTTINGVTWMAENLKTTKYNNNVPILNLQDTADWNNTTEGARCYYLNDSVSFSEEYGALYNYAAATHGDLCPYGWHVPSQTEFEDLMVFLQNNEYNYDGTTDGDGDYTTNDKTAKALGATYSFTNSDVEGAPGNYDYLSYRNRSGFSALAAGTRSTINNFGLSYSRYATFWTATEYIPIPDMAWRFQIDWHRVDARMLFSDIFNGYSVRCVMD
ncbi:MAG: FISUMP domain-containing protein [Candidatus Delongbacteria bacterium]|jgi:uncharacterized protein (TIGR02145 family)|nr:FISUMP domain-containing protein [Candidatus Delongbacteria bacterium]